MTLQKLKLIEKNGNGEYEPKPAGILFSLGGVVAALALAGNAILEIGVYQSNQEYTTDRIANLLSWRTEANHRMTQIEIDIATIRTILEERTSRENIAKVNDHE